MSSGELAARRTRRARDEVEAIAVTALRERWGDVHGRSELDDLAAAVAAGETDPYTAADELLAPTPIESRPRERHSLVEEVAQRLSRNLVR